MRKKKIAILYMTFAIVASVLGGCGNKNEPKQSAEPAATNVVSETVAPTEEALHSAEAFPSTEATAPSKEPSPSPEPSPTQTAEEETQEFTLAGIANLTFDFASGAGGWCTELVMKEDGTFTGNFHDSDMGSTGEGYPNGTLYLSSFKGKFSNPVKVNDYTYKMQLEQIETTDEKEGEEIVDGVKYIYSGGAYGLDNAKDVLIFLPGAPIKELPEGFLDWIYCKSALNQDVHKRLPFYGLYNVAEEQGWSCYNGADAYPIDVELEEVEKQSAEIDKKLENELLTQQEMNALAADKYKLWDDELNSIWNLLKYTLLEDKMEPIRKEEREWIKRKEKEVKAAGDENGGGSLGPFLESITGAEMTRDRVYELAKIVRSWD